MTLFKKVACFTDIHFGLKSNSTTHLRDCEEFVDWFIETAKKEGCETAIFLGDWSHNRNSLNLITLDSSIRCLEKLGAAFEQFFGSREITICSTKTSAISIALRLDDIFQASL